VPYEIIIGAEGIKLNMPSNAAAIGTILRMLVSGR